MDQVFEIPPEGIDLYIYRRTLDLSLLKKALAKKDTQDFFRIGHGLKGNAVNFGFPELESIGENLEVVALQQDWVLAESLISSLDRWCKIETSNPRSSKNLTTYFP